MLFLGGDLLDRYENAIIMNTLVEISKLVTSSRNFFEIKDKIIEKMLNVIPPKKACVNLFYESNYSSAYLVCSETLDYIPKLFQKSKGSKGIEIEFDKYPLYIQDAVKNKEFILIEDIFLDPRAEGERAMAYGEKYKGRAVFPLFSGEDVVGFMTCFLGSNDNLTSEEISFVSSVASIIGLSIEITNQNNDIDNLVGKLRKAIESIGMATTEIHKNKGLDMFLKLIGEQVCNLTRSESALIVLDDSTNRTQSFAAYGKDIDIMRVVDAVDKVDGFEETGGLLSLVDLPPKALNEGVTSLIYHKLIRDGKFIGFIVAVNGENYSLDDLSVINIYSTQIVIALSMYLNTAKILESRLMDREIQLAADQQKMIFSDQMMAFKDEVEVRFIHRPSKKIGGDFCEIYKIDDDSAIVFIADVMGHGLMSNYFVAMLKGVLKTLLLQTSNPAEILNQMNRILYDDLDRLNIFITARVSVLDFKNKLSRGANAGHYFPIGVLQEEGEVKTKQLSYVSGIPLGVLKDAEYEEYVSDMEKYRHVVYYTDGIIEAKGSHNEEYGIDRLKRLLRNNYNSTSEELCQNLQKEIKSFTDGAGSQDDVIFVVIEQKLWERGF